ncbi:hypothetical protein K438DRAFT_2014361 [Mycena galopus ATCC 62051]|nr:hypothetical protein K438DRAFT_2014361 [Mycena galopus ATCC 62051]
MARFVVSSAALFFVAPPTSWHRVHSSWRRPLHGIVLCDVAWLASWHCTRRPSLGVLRATVVSRPSIRALRAICLRAPSHHVHRFAIVFCALCRITLVFSALRTTCRITPIGSTSCCITLAVRCKLHYPLAPCMAHRRITDPLSAAHYKLHDTIASPTS